MGLLSEAEQDIPGAIEWYQKAVQMEWREAAVASNNLAWLYASRDTNLVAHSSSVDREIEQRTVCDERVARFEG